MYILFYNEVSLFHISSHGVHTWWLTEFVYIFLLLMHRITLFVRCPLHCVFYNAEANRMQAQNFPNTHTHIPYRLEEPQDVVYDVPS